MRPARSASDLLADPIGRYFTARSFIVWVQTPSRIGLSGFAPLDAADHASILELFPLPMSPKLERYDLLADFSSAEDVLDRATFAVFEGYLRGYIDAMAPRTKRFAVVRPIGFAGASFTGLFHDWIAPRIPSKLFEKRAEALAWLQVDAKARQEIDEVLDSVSGVPPVLRRLREELANDPAGSTLESSARKLAISVRTLQRELGLAKTSFRAELLRARLRAAEARLLDTDAKIEVIGRELGYGSGPAFITMFRRARGESPQAFRERRRR